MKGKMFLQTNWKPVSGGKPENSSLSCIGHFACKSTQKKLHKKRRRRQEKNKFQSATASATRAANKCKSNFSFQFLAKRCRNSESKNVENI